MDAPPNFEESQSTNRPQRFQEMGRKNGGIPKKGSSSRISKGNDCFHKCGKPGHFIKDCPFLKQEHHKHNSDKVAKRNLGIVKGSSQQWYMDSNCSKLITESTNDFLSLKALRGGNVSSENERREELGTPITTIEAEKRVGDAALGTPDAEQNSGSHNSIDVNDDSHMEEPGPSNFEVQVSN
uniref:Uncharacterized protein LOC104235116 n=1 Tax=Nicotiana sylvestris TaxID=4096 RepID=A0A1U7X4S1_NICSY|nr:PREDICTED: uncharacterized protein LOC104235116 [Nicotiana sylvestris]